MNSEDKKELIVYVKTFDLNKCRDFISQYYFQHELFILKSNGDWNNINKLQNIIIDEFIKK